MRYSRPWLLPYKPPQHPPTRMLLAFTSLWMPPCAMGRSSSSAQQHVIAPAIACILVRHNAERRAALRAPGRVHCALWCSTPSRTCACTYSSARSTGLAMVAMVASSMPFGKLRRMMAATLPPALCCVRGGEGLRTERVVTFHDLPWIGVGKRGQEGEDCVTTVRAVGVGQRVRQGAPQMGVLGCAEVARRLGSSACPPTGQQPHPPASSGITNHSSLASTKQQWRGSTFGWRPHVFMNRASPLGVGSSRIWWGMAEAAARHSQQSQHSDYGGRKQFRISHFYIQYALECTGASSLPC